MWYCSSCEYSGFDWLVYKMEILEMVVVGDDDEKRRNNVEEEPYFIAAETEGRLGLIEKFDYTAYFRWQTRRVSALIRRPNAYDMHIADQRPVELTLRTKHRVQKGTARKLPGSSRKA